MKPSERIDEICREIIERTGGQLTTHHYRWAALMAYLDETLPAKETFKDAEGRTLTFTR